MGERNRERERERERQREHVRVLRVWMLPGFPFQGHATPLPSSVVVRQKRRFETSHWLSALPARFCHKRVVGPNLNENCVLFLGVSRR